MNIKQYNISIQITHGIPMELPPDRPMWTTTYHTPDDRFLSIPERDVIVPLSSISKVELHTRPGPENIGVDMASGPDTTVRSIIIHQRGSVEFIRCEYSPERWERFKKIMKVIDM